jgi:endonuclease/exonuclease/phosphatase (EEP) superfamily protein YafD
MRKVLALVLVVVVFAVFAVVGGSKVESTCGGYVSTPPVIKGLNTAQKLGESVKRMIDGGPTPLEILSFVNRSFDMVGMLWDEFTGASKGLPEPSAATGWRNEVADKQRRALASCCPQQTAPTSPEQGTPPAAPVQPWDPKQASISTKGAGSFTAEQVSIAATAARIANQRNLPRQALVDILAAGFVESGIRNLNYGDRDSLGWLQQRAGWGTAQQRQDPAYAAGKFYDALVRVPNWQGIGIAAVQKVQISGFPGRYAAWQDEAQTLAAQVGGTAPVAGDSQQAAQASCSGTPNANVATWNTFVHNGTSDVVSGVKAIAAKGADVVGLQELSDTARRHAVEATLPDFTMVGRDSATPILLRNTTYPTILSQKTQLAIPAHQAFEGPTQGARYVVSVTAKDSNGQTVSYVNTHMLPKVQLNGQLNMHWPKRIGWYRKQLGIVTTTAAQLRSQGPVILMGDMNYDGDPDGAFGSAGFTASSSVLGTMNTHGTRDIDHVWASGATPASEELLPHFGSDHAPKMVRFVAPTAQQVAQAAGSVASPAAFNLPGNRTADQAIAYMTGLGHAPQGTCLHVVATAYGHTTTQQVNGHYFAVGQWDAMPSQYRHPGSSDIPPRGALVFWRTGNPAGHIAISLGNGQVVSTDFDGHGYAPGVVGSGPISEIDKWGPRAGWASPWFVGRTGGTAA